MIKKFGDKRDWFFEKRFGMFVHWGIYSIPAWHEQIMWRKNISRDKYVKYMDSFNPLRFNPEKWLDLMQEAGMEYLCFTTKHHDGFCMWDTKYTDFNIMNSPYKKDILKMLSDACHKRKIPLVLYYSVVDWHHPNYPNQGRSHELDKPEKGDRPDIPKYMEFLKNQIRELCTNYGKIHGIWWDMNTMGHVDKSVHKMIRKLQPQAIINDRGFDKVKRGPGNGDFCTPEREMPEGMAFNYPTEACQSLGVQSWGYREEEDFFSDKFMMQSIDRILSMGGNYLLNVGPKADGTIQAEFRNSLRKIGRWFNKVKESYYGASPASNLTDNKDILITEKEKSLYIHLYKGPVSSTVKLNPLKKMPRHAVLLNNGLHLEAKVDSACTLWKNIDDTLRIRKIPVNRIQNEPMVIRLDF
ncbi:MAG: glycoside hydrolase [Lentisphaerae bacterium GWF2_44_16]|nr:MAG: glycoside hydrolase [Lentisphaerae bacterium GWF2_44_16]